MRKRLEERILAFIADEGSDSIEDLVSAIVEYQRGRSPAVSRFLGSDPPGDPIPPLPVAAFKEGCISTADEAEAAAVFETSGTTTGRPGRHYLEDLEPYHHASVRGMRANLVPDGLPLAAYALLPRPGDAPRSSLVKMVEWFMKEIAAVEGGWFVEGGILDAKSLVSAIMGETRPMILLGPAFACLSLLDYMEKESLSLTLPPGSRVMDTGGYKGRNREVPRDELHRLIEERLGIPRDHIVGEYGMTEASSQFWETVLTDGRRGFKPPHWARVSIIDPVTMRALPSGEEGLVALLDPVNLYSYPHLLTDDLGRIEGGRLFLTGRIGGAEARGCSLLMGRTTVRDLAARRELDRAGSPSRGIPSGGTSGKAIANDTGAGAGAGAEIAAEIATLEAPDRAAVLDALDGLAEEMEDPSSGARRRILAAASATLSFSPPVIEEGLLAASRSWRDLRYLVSGAARFERVGLILPKNAPAAFLSALPQILAAGCSLVVKAPCEGGIEDAIVRELSAIEPTLEASILIGSWQGGGSEDHAAASEIDAAVVFGTDDAVDQWGWIMGKGRLLGYGSRFSVAFVGGEEETGASANASSALAEEASGAARDIAAWDQFGCLSPQTIFVEGRDRAEEFSRLLARELARLEKKFPRGRITPPTAAAIRRIRAVMAVRGAILLAPRETSWTVILDHHPALEETPLGRTVLVRAIDGPDDLKELLHKRLDHIEAIGLSGCNHHIFDDIGPWRTLPIGMMSEPPISRHHGGLPPLYERLTV